MTLVISNLRSISTVLPHDWRKQIADAHPNDITVRQVTEVYNLRSTHPERNTIVWTALIELVKNSGLKNRDQLVQRMQNRITYCNSLKTAK